MSCCWVCGDNLTGEWHPYLSLALEHLHCGLFGVGQLTLILCVAIGHCHGNVLNSGGQVFPRGHWQ